MAVTIRTANEAYRLKLKIPFEEPTAPERLICARNDRAAFQLILNSDRQYSVNVAQEDWYTPRRATEWPHQRLRVTGESALDLRLQSVDYVRDDDVRKTDVLSEQGVRESSAGEPSAVWCEVTVPADAAPGDYAVTLRVYAAFPDRPYVRTAVAWGLAFGLYLVNWLVIRPTAYPTTPVWNCILSEKMGDMYAFTPGDGFPILGSNVYLADKYPAVCFPYLSRVLFGVGLVGLLYPAKRSLLPRLDRGWQRPVSFVGRHTLWVVVIHQVIIAALLALITGWFVTPGNYGF